MMETWRLLQNSDFPNVLFSTFHSKKIHKRPEANTKRKIEMEKI